MVDVVQLVRASDCGSECRGFESHLPPRTFKKRKATLLSSFFAFIPAGIKKKKTNTFKHLIYNILLKVAHPINLGGNFLILQKIYTFVP